MPQAIPAIIYGLGAVGGMIGLSGTAAVLAGGLIVGAAVGGITAAITGGDILTGMMYGAIGGVCLAGGALALAEVGVGMGVGTVGEVSAAGSFGEAMFLSGNADAFVAGVGGGGGILGGTSGGVAASGGFMDGMGAALVAGVGSMASGFLGEEVPDHTLETLASQERMNSENAQTQKEIAQIQANAAGGSGDSTDQMALAMQQAEAQAAENALDRELSREQLASSVQTATDDRKAAIKQTRMQAQNNIDLRAMDDASVKLALENAKAGAVSTGATGGGAKSRSTDTIEDKVTGLKGEDATEAPDPATIVPVEYVEA